jgi:hypothetical protein
MNEYTAGRLVRCTATFQPSVDPDALAFRWATMGADGRTPGAAQIEPMVRDAEGVYHADIDTTGVSGMVVYTVVATGVGASADSSAFRVKALPV